MQTYYLDSTVHIGLVVPARTRTVLVFDTCNLILLDYSEYGLVGIYLLTLLLLCVCAQGHHSHERHHHDFFHFLLFYDSVDYCLFSAIYASTSLG